jgi:hypothetical protein
MSATAGTSAGTAPLSRAARLYTSVNFQDYSLVVPHRAGGMWLAKTNPRREKTKKNDESHAAESTMVGHAGSSLQSHHELRLSRR